MAAACFGPSSGRLPKICGAPRSSRLTWGGSSGFCSSSWASGRYSRATSALDCGPPSSAGFLTMPPSAQVHQVVFQGLLAGHKVSQANGHDAQIHPHHPIDDRDQENQPRPFCAEQLAYSRRMRIICGRMIAASKTTEITQTSNFADSSNMGPLPQVAMFRVPVTCVGM